MTKHEIVFYDDDKNVIAKKTFKEDPVINEGIIFIKDLNDVAYGYKNWAWYEAYEVKE